MLQVTKKLSWNNKNVDFYHLDNLQICGHLFVTCLHNTFCPIKAVLIS